ncbi:MAG: ATP-dependent DNA helicase RecG [Clostridiales bacterium]|nr:ATP-dependent DNA helicase RecG [Clostridiales bacterium]
MKPDSPISSLKGIGPKTEELFHLIGVYTVGDILLYFPRDYERYPQICDPDMFVPEQKNAVFARAPKSPSVHVHSHLKTAVLDVSGENRTLRILWFRAPYIRSVVKAGGFYVFYGKVTEKDGRYYMEQPEILSRESYEAAQKTLRPVYGLTKGLSNKLVIRTVQAALADIPLEMEYLPEDVRVRNSLCEYNYALKNIHLPVDEESCITARDRLVFDEFFFFILCMQLTRDQSMVLKNEFTMIQPGMQGADDADFVASLTEQLPYPLTGAQQRTIRQIQADMRSEHVMQRLIQGDVGSGKTIVAFLAMLDCANSGYQSAIMAPTDVLARQHAQRLTELTQRLGLSYPVILLTGSLTARERREAYAALEREKSALIVGTHALIQEKVTYNRLALVITDEQHRFGVKQREAFFRKGPHPHIMVMSATPIPRTLAIILYGDMDISVIDELPAKRRPIRNCVVDTSFREKAYRFIENQVREGHQAYVICPLVEETEHSEGENVLDYVKRLREVFPDEIRVAGLHGRMKAEEKNQIMEAFLENRIQVLVSTTVIEVGVDVANATVMMIENAGKFGLAQLHQLRGRVGRGDAQSYCIFMQGTAQEGENARLAVLNKSNDGFFIAGEDLKLRGPGDFFGIRQSGEFRFRLADIYQDAGLMEKASREAAQLLREDPGLTDPSHRALRERLRVYAGEDFSLLNL